MLSGFGLSWQGTRGRLPSNIVLTNPAMTNMMEVYSAVKPQPPIIFWYLSQKTQSISPDVVLMVVFAGVGVVVLSRYSPQQTSLVLVVLVVPAWQKRLRVTLKRQGCWGSPVEGLLLQQGMGRGLQVLPWVLSLMSEMQKEGRQVGELQVVSVWQMDYSWGRVRQVFSEGQVKEVPLAIVAATSLLMMQATCSWNWQVGVLLAFMSLMEVLTLCTICAQLGCVMPQLLSLTGSQVMLQNCCEISAVVICCNTETLLNPCESNMYSLQMIGGLEKWEVWQRVKELPLRTCRDSFIDPDTTRLVYAMGLSPEKRIMGPKMMRRMRMNPLHPIILQYQGIVCPRMVVVVAEQQLILDVNELRYMLNCLDQSPSVRLVAEKVQSMIIFTSYRKGMAVQAETMQQFTYPLLVMRELRDLNYLNPYLICRADRQKQMKQKKEKAMRAGLGEQKEADRVRDALQGARQNTNQQKRQKMMIVQMYLVMTFCRLGTMRMVMQRSMTILATWTSTPMTMSLLNWQYLVAYQRVYPLTSVMRGQKKMRQMVRKICTAAMGGQKSAPIFLQEKTERKEASLQKRRSRLFSIQQAAMLKGLMFQRNSCSTSLYFQRYSLDRSSSLMSTRRKAFSKFSTSSQSLNLLPLYLITSCCRKMTTKRKQRQPDAYYTLPSFTSTKNKNLITAIDLGSDGRSSICTNSPAKMRRKMQARRRKVNLRLAITQQQKEKASSGRESRQGLMQQQISISSTISTYRLLRKRATSCTLPFQRWQKLSGRMASLEEISSSMILGTVSRCLYSPSDPTHPTCALTYASTSAMASESFWAMESAATLICSSNSVNSCSSTSQSSLMNLQADSFNLWQAVSPPIFWVTQRRVSQQSNARATSVCVQHMS